MTNNPVADAMAVLAKAMKEDPSYRQGWQANLAVMMQDEGVSHSKSNERADGFIKTAFGV